MCKEKSNLNIILIILLAILIIAVIGFGGYFIWKFEFDKKNNSQQTSSNNVINDNSNSNQKTEEKKKKASEPASAETKEDYMKSCATYTFKEIARNPNSYKGKRAKITGEVIQVQQDGNEVVLRVNMTKQDGYYTDTIMAGYAYSNENEDRILEDDIVTIYGELYGTITYTSVMGAEVTVPAIKTMYLDIENK